MPKNQKRAEAVVRAKPLTRQTAHEFRGNEKQVWFLSQHLVNIPLVKED